MDVIQSCNDKCGTNKGIDKIIEAELLVFKIDNESRSSTQWRQLIYLAMDRQFSRLNETVIPYPRLIFCLIRIRWALNWEN